MNVAISVHEDAKLAQVVKELALEGFVGLGKPETVSREKYVWLRERGSRLWLDTGDASAAQPVWSAELDSLTTNNTLVNKVVQTGAMDGLIAYGARKIRDVRPDISERDLVIEIAFLVNARLALDLISLFGAHVSVEVHPDVGFDVNRTLLFARRYYDICPDNFYVKVPLTPDGFVAARRLSQEGIPINFTLGFSARQNYLATRFSNPRFVNVFLGRLNQLVEENNLGSSENIGEKATLASDKMVKNVRASQDETQTWQIAASLRSGDQVVKLAGVDVLTIPPNVAEQYLDMNLSRDDIQPQNWRDLKVSLNPDRSVEASLLSQLWTIDEKFIAFVEDAVKQADMLQSGDALVNLSRKHGVNLFNDWSAEDREEIREKGKIPDLSQWPAAPVDDLMSISALESFAKDQTALDNRISGMIQQSA